MLITVAMATYNGQSYIRQQLNSILNQTYQELEIIIVDDCSSDNTLELITSFKDERITVLSNDYNMGVAKSFERAIENASGDYIALCDQDDIWVANKLETLMVHIGNNELIYSDYSFIDHCGNKIEKPEGYINYLHGVDSSTKNFDKLVFINSFILGCSVLFKATLKTKILPIVDAGFNHDKWIVNIAANSGGGYYLNKKLFMYRIHGANASMAKDIKRGFLEKLKFFIFEKKRKDYYDYKTTLYLNKLFMRYNSTNRNLHTIAKVIFCVTFLPILGRVVYISYFRGAISARYVNSIKSKLKAYLIFFISR
ncbi:glycosyltransferase [Escherichia coli]|uniref:glycosyltransferase n=1 Tax=Escherichia coli TaxID=562 RepID=UPI00248C4F6A|nr:glycosyltransferase [Escherichia coli]